MEEELRILAYITKIDRQELMRRMVSIGLETAWTELIGGKEPTVVSTTSPDAGDISAAAKVVLEQEKAT